MKNPTFLILSPLLLTSAWALTAHAAPLKREKNWIDHWKCNEVAVMIRQPEDVLRLMDLLPTESESHDLGSLIRSVELGSTQDSLRIECMISSHSQAVCSWVYRQFFVGEESCDSRPTQFRFNPTLSRTLVQKLEAETEVSYRTADGVLELHCEASGCTLTLTP